MYLIMHRNTVIATATDCIQEIINKDLCPQCFCIGMPLQYWLDNRFIDIHRAHSRRLFRALRMRSSADLADIIKAGHGITITDNWWIREANEDIQYRALKKYNESIADIALIGSDTTHKNLTVGYSELGTVGSFEKCWKFINNSWYMYKQGSIQELISEYYSYCFLKAMNTPVAEYKIITSTSQETGLSNIFMVTKDFTRNASVDFEPFCNMFDENEEPEYIIPKLKEKSILTDYIVMLFYDILLYNGDRHNQNVGVLRDVLTGSIIELAPKFDYNQSLLSVGTPYIDLTKGNILANYFLDNKVCRDVLKGNLPELNTIQLAIKQATNETKKEFNNVPLKYEVIENYIINTYKYIRDRIL